MWVLSLRANPLVLVEDVDFLLDLETTQINLTFGD